MSLGDKISPVTEEEFYKAMALMEKETGLDTEKCDTVESFMKFQKAFCDKMCEITKAKNHDYGGFSKDPFGNFKVVEHNGIASPEVGFLVRMTDKMSRLASFVSQGTLKVEDEKIADTLMDLANYSILMAGYLKQKKNEIT